MTKTRAARHVIVVDNTHVARAIGERIRHARVRAGLTQAQLAKGRYTGAYISALERALAKPSMAALTFISERLGVPMRDLVGDESGTSTTRLEADLALASGDYQAALDAYEGLLDQEPRDRRTRAELLRGKAEALYRLTRGGEAIASASEAAELFGALGADADAAWAKYWLAAAQYQSDNVGEARSIFQELLAAERSGLKVAPEFRFRLLTSLANVELWDGQPKRAITYMEEAKALTADLDLHHRAVFLSSLATHYLEAGDLERSIRTGTESLALYRMIDAEREEVVLENNLAVTYLQVGNSARASRHVKRARELVGRNPNPRDDAQVAETEARVAWARGDGATADERLDRAIATGLEGGVHHTVAHALATRARIARERGDLDLAAKAYRAASDYLREHGPAAHRREVLGEWAELLTGQGDLAGATALYAEALGRPAGNGKA